MKYMLKNTIPLATTGANPTPAPDPTTMYSYSASAMSHIVFKNAISAFFSSSVSGFSPSLAGRKSVPK